MLRLGDYPSARDSVPQTWGHAQVSAPADIPRARGCDLVLGFGSLQEPINDKEGRVAQLGDRLRALRLERGLTQRELAESVGVGFPHISRIEAGRDVPSNALLDALARKLQTDPDELYLLARRLPEDLSEVILEKDDLASQFLRSWREGEIDDAAVRELLERARKEREP